MLSVARKSAEQTMIKEMVIKAKGVSFRDISDQIFRNFNILGFNVKLKGKNSNSTDKRIKIFRLRVPDWIHLGIGSDEDKSTITLFYSQGYL